MKLLWLTIAAIPPTAGKLPRRTHAKRSCRQTVCPDNSTKSCRFRHALRVAGEVTDWQGHSPEQLNAMKEHLERLKQLGIEAIKD